MDQVAATLVFKKRRIGRVTNEPAPTVVRSAVEMLRSAKEVYNTCTVPGVPSAFVWFYTVFAMCALLWLRVLSYDAPLSPLIILIGTIPLLWIIVHWFSDRIKQDVVYRYGAMVTVPDTPEARAMTLVKDPAYQYQVDMCIGGPFSMCYYFSYPRDVETACHNAYTLLCDEDMMFRGRPHEEQVFVVALKAVYDYLR